MKSSKRIIILGCDPVKTDGTIPQLHTFWAAQDKSELGKGILLDAWKPKYVSYPAIPLITGTSEEDETPGKEKQIFELVLDEKWKPNSEILGEGIYQQFQKNRSIEIVNKELNYKDIEDYLRSIFTSKSRRTGNTQRNFKFITGERGMFSFHWTMVYGGTLECNFHIHYFKHYKGIYLSLFKKSGPYKLKVMGENIVIFKGTEVIKTFTNMNVFGEQYKEKHGFDFSDGLVRQTNLKMKQLNNYLKELQYGSK